MESFKFTLIEENGVVLVPEAGLLGRKTQSLSDSNTQPPL